MSYEDACRIMGYSPNNDKKYNAMLAQSALHTFVSTTPLKYSVAAQTIIDAAKKK